MELFKASNQWATRPDDERFSSVQALHVACANYRHRAATASVAYRDLKAVAYDDGAEVMLQASVAQARVTHWAFGQLCARAKSPAGYLRSLPAPLAAQCLNQGLQANHESDETAQLMFHRDVANDSLLLRAMTSDKYDRIWNSDITRRLLALTDDGWRLPPARPARPNQMGARPATADDVLPDAMAGDFGLSVKIGDMIAPAGAYASDHDLFVFLIDPTRSIKDPTGQTLWRGFFTWNSEVGAATFGIESFLFRHVCGNHIVWSAQDVKHVRIRHVGDAETRSREMLAEVYKYRDQAASDDENALRKAGSYRLGNDKDAVLDALFKLRLPVGKTVLEQAVDCTAQLDGADGDPFSAYGVANGLTRLSQQIGYADQRVEMDRAAGKILSVAF